MTERDTDTAGGSLYNSILYVSEEGEVLGVHRKLMPTHAERIVWGQGDGSTLHVVETAAGRVGGLTCWEHWMPLARFAMHAEGEQIHVAAWPEVGDPELHRFASRHYAFEGRCFSLCVMGASMTAGALPEGFELREAMGAADDFIEAASGTAPRGTSIFAPDGTVVPTRRGRGDDRLRRSRPRPDRGGAAALDVVGHYNRPDIFDLRVDGSSAPACDLEAPSRADIQSSWRPPSRTAEREKPPPTPHPPPPPPPPPPDDDHAGDHQPGADQPRDGDALREEHALRRPARSPGRPRSWTTTDASPFESA